MFFQEEATLGKLKNLLAIASSLNFAEGDHTQRKAQHLARVIEIFIQNTKEFDKFCHFSTGRFGGMIKDVSFTNVDVRSLNLDLYLAIFFVVVCEYDMCVQDELSDDLREYRNFVDENRDLFNSQAKAIIEFGQVRLPAALLKSLLSDTAVADLKEVPKIAQDVHGKVKEWKRDLKNQTATVKQLQSMLEKQRDAFNFVGLFSGFNDLSKSKKAELLRTRIMMVVLAFAVLMPVGFDISLLFTHREQVLAASTPLVSAFIAVTFSATFLFIYFYRVFLKSADACKAQLLQIELRKTLCQFIQRYVKYADDLKQNKELLQKFETIIFSPISYSEDKSVSMFDGLDQVASVVKAARG